MSRRALADFPPRLSDVDAVSIRNAAFTTGAGVNYGSSALTVMNDELSRIGLEPLPELKLQAGQRLRPAT